jgi:hypothetical protein
MHTIIVYYFIVKYFVIETFQNKVSIPGVPRITYSLSEGDCLADHRYNPRIFTSPEYALYRCKNRVLMLVNVKQLCVNKSESSKLKSWRKMANRPVPGQYITLF